MDLLLFKPACNGIILPSTSLLLLLAMLNDPVSTQSITGASSIPTPIPPIAILSTSSTRSIVEPESSLTTSYTSSTSNTTSSSEKTRATDETPGLFPFANPDSDQPDVESERSQGVFNYYFLILAVFGVVVAVALWWIRRRRKRRKEQMRLSGQDALARDLDGWVSTRRWMHGAWRHNQTAGFVRREEGLNEHGEAPPPYQPKSEVAVAPDGTRQDAASGLAIPLRTLSRDEIETIQPPEYEERLRRVETSSDRPGTATTRNTRPETADPRPSSSRNLLVQGPAHPND